MKHIIPTLAVRCIVVMLIKYNDTFLLENVHIAVLQHVILWFNFGSFTLIKSYKLPHSTHASYIETHTYHRTTFPTLTADSWGLSHRNDNTWHCLCYITQTRWLCTIEQYILKFLWTCSVTCDNFHSKTKNRIYFHVFMINHWHWETDDLVKTPSYMRCDSWFR